MTCTCPKCKIVLVKLGDVECKTGDAVKLGCPQCRGIWFQQKGARDFDFGPERPLRQTMERLAATTTLA